MDLYKHLTEYLKALKAYRGTFGDKLNQLNLGATVSYLNSLISELVQRPLPYRVEELSEVLRERLTRKTAALKSKIVELTGRQYYIDFGAQKDMWIAAFNPHMGNQTAPLDFCIDAVNDAIGIIESGIVEGTRDKLGNLIQKEETHTTSISSPTQIFEAMQFHPKVVEASKSCFATTNYREAILNASIKFIDDVKEKTSLDLDGDDLMNQVFSFDYDKKLKKVTRYPIISINELKTVYDRDEQQGFMYLCKGVAVGIRNPKAHKLIPQSNPLHTLEYLALASLLMRRVEEGTLASKEHKS